jgi:hypothetical protein
MARIARWINQLLLSGDGDDAAGLIALLLVAARRCK